jgi:hypothetical protein
VRKSVGIRPMPTWVRGPATIEDDCIVLDLREAERYEAFRPVHSSQLLSDMARLVELDFGARLFSIDRSRVRSFVERHGLIWHSPESLGEGEVREELSDWTYAAAELQLSVMLLAKLREAAENDSAQIVRDYMRSLRDFGVFRRMYLPDDDDELLDFVSIQLSERITRGMEDCTPTLLTMCSLIKEDGSKAGLFNDFRFSNCPKSLLGAANYELASLISRKEWFLLCEGCGRMFQPIHGHQTFCETRCSERSRKRRQRKRKRTDS